MSQKRNKNKILFFRESTFKIAELIFNYPNKIFHIRMLEKETGFSTTAVISSINELTRFNIILVEKTSLTTNIKSNFESESYVFYKKVFNLYRLERYGFINQLNKIFSPETLVLFGSFAKGEDIEESDIDVLIITHRKISGKETEEFIKTYEKEFNRKISLHILTSLNKSLPEFKNAVANGIVLKGYLKVI